MTVTENATLIIPNVDLKDLELHRQQLGGIIEDDSILSTLTPDCTLSMPVGSIILTVQEQEQRPCLWALVDPAAPHECRRFRTYGTGHPVADDPGEYIGTFQLNGGSLVFHLFEEQL